MGKKKKNESRGISGMLSIAAIMALGGMIAFLVMSGHGDHTGHAPEQAVEQNAGGLVETRPTIPSSTFTGRIAEAYRYAEEIPSVIDSLYCYCKCKENPRFRHKTLLTCYVDDHAANCGVCMTEAEIAWDMTKQGKGIDEIKAEIDRRYADKPHG